MLDSEENFQNKFRKLSNYNGFTIYIDEVAEKLLKNNNIIIDEGGWYFYKKLTVVNAPIVRLSSKNTCYF